MSGADIARPNKDSIGAMKAAQTSKNDAAVALLQNWKPLAALARPAYALPSADSARLYAVRVFDDADSVLAAIRQGRRSFAACSLKQLDLANANLALLDFRGCDLSGCDFRGAILIGADLRGAVLRNAYLRKADLRRALLDRAAVSDAYLTHADLRDVKGLQLDQLRKTRNLFGARLDEELAELAKKYCASHLKDPGNDWVGNPWYAKSTVKEGDRPEEAQ
jgi:hypothetical protein